MKAREYLMVTKHRIMKQGILSISIALIGFYFIYWFNHNLLEHITTLTNPKENTIEVPKTILTISKTYRITTICIGLLSLYFGIISFLKKHKIGSIGILLAVFLIILTFIPFWQYAIQ